MSIVGVVLFAGLGATAVRLAATEGLATAVDGCRAVTVLEARARVETVGAGAVTVLEARARVETVGAGAVTVLEACEGVETVGAGAVTVLEACEGVEAVRAGVGELVGEEVLVDPCGT